MDAVQKNNFLAVYSLMAEFHAENKHCDVTIKVEDQVFRSHSLLLAAVSEYFDVMFGGDFKEGKKRRSAVADEGEPIVLHDVDASAFDEVLQFLYRGKIRITDANVHTLLYTSDFLRLRVSYVEEECVKFLKNSAKPVSSALEMLSLACVTGKKILIDLLSVHIFKHFAHFSADERFSDLSFDCLNAILKNKQRLSPNNEDALLQTICRWINHRREERRQYRAELMKNIDVSKLSGPYVTSLIEEYENFIDDVVVTASKSSSSSDESAPTFFDAYPSDGGNGMQISESKIHVFAKSSSRNRSSVKIFSSSRNSDEWCVSSEFNSTLTSMCNIVMDKTLYCLAYDCYEYPPHFPSNFSCQSFTTHEAIHASAKRYLTNPPIIMSRFELCGAQNNIYLYNKSLFHTQEVDTLRSANGAKNNDFTHDELLRDIFDYNCELDRWFPMPVPLARQVPFHHDVSAITVANGTLYFVGEEIDSDFVHLQGYDARVGQWNTVSGSPAEFGSSFYKQIQCCANQGTIYIAGFSGRQIFVHAYDLVAGRWMAEPIIMWESAKYGFGKLVSYEDDLWMIPVSRPFNIEIYDTISQEISRSWSLEEAIRKYGKPPFILDAVVF